MKYAGYAKIDMDKRLKKIIKRCTERNPTDKYKCVADIIKDLCRIPKCGLILCERPKQKTEKIDIIEELKNTITEINGDYIESDEWS